MATSISTSRPPQAASARSRDDIRRDARGYRLRQRAGGKLPVSCGSLQLVASSCWRPSGAPCAGSSPRGPTDYLTDVAGIVDRHSAPRSTTWPPGSGTATGAELAVVTLPTIEDRAPGDVALAIGRAWGVGAKAAIGDSTRNAGRGPAAGAPNRRNTRARSTSPPAAASRASSPMPAPAGSPI